MDQDEKNYHAWAHRQSIIQLFGLWAQDRAYLEAMIEKDVRNNSAWNERLWILQHAPHAMLRPTAAAAAAAARDAGAQPSSSNAAGANPPAAADEGPSTSAAGPSEPTAAAAAGDSGAKQPMSASKAADILRSELEYAAVHIKKAPRNESAWNFVRGLFTLPWVPPNSMARQSMLYTLCTEAMDDCPACVPAMDLLALYYTSLAMNARAAGKGAALVQAAKNGVAVLNWLSTADPMRWQYWSHLKAELEALMMGGGDLRSPGSDA